MLNAVLDSGRSLAGPLPVSSSLLRPAWHDQHAEAAPELVLNADLFLTLAARTMVSPGFIPSATATEKPRLAGVASASAMLLTSATVSYTHLTLPTIRLV